jgi:HNH endonuclease
MTVLPDRVAAKIGSLGTDGCWPWLGYINGDGYGRVAWHRRSTQAHRVVYELLVGPIPEGLQIDHLCRVRHCVNPGHMEPVSQAENLRRGAGPWPAAAINRDKTHCPHGHAYDEVNTIRRSDGSRRCRICNRNQCAAYAAKRRSI